MIITKTVNMSWNSYNKKYYIDLGYNFTKMREKFKIKIEDLNKNSHSKVIVACDHCKAEREIAYKDYNVRLKNKGFYVCSGCRFHKTKLTNLENHGVENISHLAEIKMKISDKGRETFFKGNEQRQKTMLEKYGVINPFQIQSVIDDIVIKTKETKIKNGLNIPDELCSDFYNYKKKVINLTRKNKIILLENWNGYDYYDGEYIKDNFNLHYHDSNYPNVDHKTTIKFGFDNNITPEEIAKLDNLCVTKLKLNVRKSSKNEDEFKNV